MEFLLNILIQDKTSKLILDNEDKIFELIPELKLCKNFSQNNIWHIYDVYEHILHVVDGVSNNIILRLAALFHDVGKPFVYTEDEKGVGHFYGHWDKSKEIFENFAKKYNIEENTKTIISNLILYHDLNIGNLNHESLTKLINILGKDGINMLYELKQSDLLAQNQKFHYLLDDYKKQKEKVLKYFK